MDKDYLILVINPGSTSTKIALYKNELMTYGETIYHSGKELEEFKSIIDQYPLRKRVITGNLLKAGIGLSQIDAVVGRGGMLKPLPGGTYKINSVMLADLKGSQWGSHASNLGALLAYEIAKEHNIPSFIVDPVVVDEMIEVARITGWSELKKRSVFHALNQKAMARRAAFELDRSLVECNFVIAHLGGGISVGAHQGGSVIDVNNALDGEGPFSPERSGSLPIGDVIKLCYSGDCTLEEIQKKVVGKGGFMSHFNTSDAREIESLVDSGNKRACLVYEALAYQVAKFIGSAAVVLKGKVDAIILTGGIAYSEKLVTWIKDRVKFIAPILIYPGEDEMLALTQGALRVLKGEESAKDYS